MILAHRSWGTPLDPVALLVHGGAGSSAQWHKLGEWLADRGWHAIAVDLRGHGETPVDAATIENPSLTVEADDLVDTTTAVRPDADGIDLLLGFSYGAVVSLTCAARHPSFPRRLALLEPGGRESSDRARFAAEKRAQHEEPEAFLRQLYTGRDRTPVDQDLEDLIRVQAASISASSLDYALARHEMFADVDVVELARRCEIPTLVLLGRDKDTPLGHNGLVMADLMHYSALIGDERQRFCSALRHGRTRVLAAGHDVYRQLSPEFVGHLSAWISDSSSGDEPRRPSSPGARAEGVPMQRIYPYLLYEDVAIAADFLSKAFGFRRAGVDATDGGHANHSHVEMELDKGFRVRMTSPAEAYRSPRRIGHVTSMIQIEVTDIEAHFARATAAGATVVRPLQERRYGDRGYIVDDLEGQRWYFIQPAPTAAT